MASQVLLVDDHKIMRDGIKAILRHSEDFTVMAEAESGTEAVQICKLKRPDIILMDIGLPGLNGIETTTEILRYNPEAKVIILSMYDDEHSVVSAIRSGARAFVLKKASDNDLLDALRTVAKGGSYLSPQVSDRLLQRIQRGDLESKPVASALSDLSPRELQVLRLVAEGKTSKEIAVMLDLGLQTVRSYRKTMMKKLGVNNVAGLTQVALAAGITRVSHPDAGPKGRWLMETPWGALAVSDAHVHFFSHGFFSSLASQKKAPVASLEGLLGWRLPAEDPTELAAAWVEELDRHGVSKAVLIASVPGDQDSVTAAVGRFPDRFYGYMMVNPTAPDAASAVERALSTGHIRGLCFFPAMHCYSIQDDRVKALLDLVAAKPGTIAFVHCGVLSVGVRKKLGLPSLFDMRFSNPIDLHGVALRYPQIRFVLPHFGAGYFRETLMLCDLCPNVYLDTSSSNSWMRYDESHLDLRTVFRRALDVAGPKRLLFGTDSSFFPRGWNAAVFEAQTKALYEIGVTGETAALLLHDNLQHLFS